MTSFLRVLSLLAGVRASLAPATALLLAAPLALGTRIAERLPARDAGMSTAEYAVGTVAAVAFAAVLYKVVRSGAVSSALSSIIEGALGISL
jgi:hypothetical protein